LERLLNGMIYRDHARRVLCRSRNRDKQQNERELFEHSADITNSKRHWLN
jgi:hypothetical protein